MPVPAYIHVTNPAGQGPAGATGPAGPQGPAGQNGTNGTTPTLTAITTDVLPSVDNTYTLGNSSYRWKSINVGPGTINITDQTLGTNAGLTVNNGVLQINGANQLQVGQLKFVDNTIESTTGIVDIQIGLISSSANIVLNRNVFMGSGKTITANSIATAVRTTTSTSVAINYLTDSIVVVSIAGGTVNFTHSNFIAGKEVKVIVNRYAYTSGAQDNHGLSSSNSTNGQSIWLPTHNTASYDFICTGATQNSVYVRGHIS